MRCFVCVAAKNLGRKFPAIYKQHQPTVVGWPLLPPGERFDQGGKSPIVLDLIGQLRIWLVVLDGRFQL